MFNIPWKKHLFNYRVYNSIFAFSDLVVALDFNKLMDDFWHQYPLNVFLHVSGYLIVSLYEPISLTSVLVTPADWSLIAGGLEWKIISDIMNLWTLSHHVLVSVSQVHGGGGVFYTGQSVADGIFLDAGVVHRPGPLPRHQQAAEVMRRRLDVLRLRTAHWQETDENTFLKIFLQMNHFHFADVTEVSHKNLRRKVFQTRNSVISSDELN